MGDSSFASGDIKVIDKPGEMYELLADDIAVGQLTYSVSRSGRRTLKHTEIDPEFRGRGLSRMLIRDALEDLRQQSVTITVFCPAVHAFIESHPDYESMVDVEHPGAWPKSTER